MIPAARNEPVIKEAWLQQAIQMFTDEKFKDGDTVSHLWLRHALDVQEARSLADAERVKLETFTRVEAFRDWLLEERQIALENIRGEGYRIVPPREQAKVAAQTAMKLVKKGLDKGSRLMHHTRLDQLDAQERRRHTDAHIRLIGVGEMMTRQRKDIFGLFRPKS